MTPPDEVVQFITSQPGLMEICERIPSRLLEFAPQLAIPGFAGPLERRIEEAFQISVRDMRTDGRGTTRAAVRLLRTDYVQHVKRSSPCATRLSETTNQQWSRVDLCREMEAVWGHAQRHTLLLII
jgi:hypothetical protein